MPIKYDLDTSTFLRDTPPVPVEGIVCYDEAKRNLQIRNSDIAWQGLMSGSASHKIWVYRNDAEIGWVIDPSVSDSVISIKGGSYSYNVNGGTPGGDNWNGLNHSHTTNSHTHTITVPHDGWKSDGNSLVDGDVLVSDGNENVNNVNHTSNRILTSDVGSGNTGTTNFSWRPAAAVGTLQNLDV